jgi:hypothetical protein
MPLHRICKRHFIFLLGIFLYYANQKEKRENAMRNAVSDILKSLSPVDVEALQSIYMYRCLTPKQLYQLHYNTLSNHEQTPEDVVKTKIETLVSLGLIEEVERISKVIQEGVEPVYFLTPLGVEVVRYCFDLPANVYDSKKQVVKRGYYRASELKIYPKNINHQVHLNQFIIDFAQMNPDIHWKYYDEKHVSQFSSIRPDGILTMLDTDFFIEMDLATESQKQLLEKWDNYRNFLLSREYAYKEKKIILLFICEGTSRLKERVDLVKYTIFERLIDVMDSDFEVYVGSKEQILKLLSEKLIPALKGQYIPHQQIAQILTEKHGFHVSNGFVLKDVFNGTEFDFYFRKINENKHILIENNRIQEFVLDEYSFAPMSVLNKIAYLDKNNVFFKEKFQREISYIVVGESEEQIYHDLKLVDLIGVKNVYFTTFHRLNTLPFHEALFQFDFLGNIHHFSNSGLNERIFEQTLNIPTE